MTGYLVLETGETYKGTWLGGKPRAGEVVFNTSHNGYEEIATDPSYYGQIMVMCAPQQGNYGVDDDFWESRQLWIEGFIALEIEKVQTQWHDRLEKFAIPHMDSVDTRKLVLALRDQGTQVGALVPAESETQAKEMAAGLINRFKEKDKDWTFQVSRKQKEVLKGQVSSGPHVAVIDYGCKQNILRELIKRCSQVTLFPSRAIADDILADNPDGILLSNGPGDPSHVESSIETIQNLIGQKAIFGICMGHQLLARALGGQTFKLKFGHRGANHPIKNLASGEVFMTSQNHGYAVESEGLDSGVKVTHLNLNDNTVSGIENKAKKCFSVQFHPESHPGPRDADYLFDQFIDWMKR